MTKKFNFETTCITMLKQLGAVPESGNEGYYLELQTIAGKLRCHTYDDWLACRFDDVPAAKSLIGFGNLNPYSGKWNWHYTKPTQQSIDSLRASLQSILPKEKS